MKVGFQQAPEFIPVTPAKKPQRLNLAFIGAELAFHRVQVELHAVAVHEWPDEAAFMEQMHRLRRRVNIARVAGVEAVGRENLAHQRGCIQQQQDRATEHCDPMAPELPPHDAPLRRPVELLLLRRQCLDRLGLKGRRRYVVLQRWVAAWYSSHWATPPVSRIRGSSAASNKSEMNMPTTVNVARNIKKEPARY